ncbi:hypothetical protein MPER_10588 [Moniliophthora perniciosa FA553]|nr:hypothetical protein MPER_10588 [Moniliophthora perniciosa FA553]
MPQYRRPLADLILRFLRDGKAKTGRELGAMWKLVGQEIVLRCVESVSSLKAPAEDASMQSFLQTLLDTAASAEISDDDDSSALSDDEAGGGITTPTPASIHLSRVAGQSQTREEGGGSEGVEKGPQMPSVMSLLSSFSGGGDSEHSTRRNRSGSISLRGVAVDPVPTPAAVSSSNLGNVFENDTEDKEMPVAPYTSLNLLAVSALVEVFAELAFSGYASLGVPSSASVALAQTTTAVVDPNEVDAIPEQDDSPHPTGVDCEAKVLDALRSNLF